MLTDSSAPSPSKGRQLNIVIRSWRIVAALALCSGTVFIHAAEAPKKSGLKTGELYQATNVWTAHFTFTAEQWKAMEPAQTGGGGRMQGGPGGPGA